MYFIFFSKIIKRVSSSNGVHVLAGRSMVDMQQLSQKSIHVFFQVMVMKFQPYKLSKKLLTTSRLIKFLTKYHIYCVITMSSNLYKNLKKKIQRITDMI